LLDFLEKGKKMENVKETIAANLVALRKSKRWTQQELAEKLAYSDKAVSRWEHAETLTDLETLCKICDLYGVKFEYHLQKEQPKDSNPYLVKNNIGTRMLIMFIAVCSVWIAAFFIHMSVSAALGKNLWELFVWAIPLSALVCQLYNKLYFTNRILACVMQSIFSWAVILAVYLQFISHNFWMLFILGVPVQAVIVLMTILKIKTSDSDPGGAKR
jgi:transcriptional regulator with XRE-family HTH domain